MSKINRLKELNKIWVRLTAPKEGDKVKFKITGKKRVFEGKITAAIKYGNEMRYQVWSLTAPVGDQEIEIIECNGIQFQRVLKSDTNKFKPI